MNYEYNYSTTTTTASPEDVAAAGAALLAVVLLSLFLSAIVYVIVSIFLGKIFKKAGVPSWAAWVPYYNSWKTFEIGGQQGFWAILMIIPVVNLVAMVFYFIAMYHIGLKLGKSGAFIVLGIFLPVVWMIWLAVDSSTWDESKSDAKSLAKEHQFPTQTPPAGPTGPTQPTPPSAPVA